MYMCVQFEISGEVKMRNKMKLFPVLAFLFALGVTLAGCGGSSPWADGWYAGEGEGVHGTIALSVLVEKGKIARIRIDEQHETEGVSDIALEEIPLAVIEAQSTEVDSVSGASVTSGGILEAVNAALDKAAKAKQ